MYSMGVSRWIGVITCTITVVQIGLAREEELLIVGVAG